MPVPVSERSKNFWYRFDNETLWQRTPAVQDAMSRAYFDNGLTFDSVMEALRVSFAAPDHPGHFLSVVGPGANGFLDLASIQLAIMDEELGGEPVILEAFEAFGQGILFDDRPPRPPGRHIHMMDGTPDTWVGYHRWHAFARAVALLGADSQRWLHVNQCIALAWAIQTEADPPRDGQNNPGLPPERVSELRSGWMAATQTQLDWAFVNHRFRAPMLDAIPRERQTLTYARIQSLLGDAAGTLQPFHDGHGRFWELPYADFMVLPPVYGETLIADPGPDRGERSAIVKILRGTLAGFPRMPLNRPEMSDADIAIIRDWIDADCPES